MIAWPSKEALLNAIRWNSTAFARARIDVENEQLVVPPHAVREVWQLSRCIHVPLNREQYRARREKDALRHAKNIKSIELLLENFAHEQ